MSWTAPTYAGIVSSTNLNLLYNHTGYLAASAYSVGSAFTYNTDAQDFAEYDRISALTFAPGDGVAQMRIVMQCQISAVGTCTSFTPRLQAFVQATTSGGTVNTTIPLWQFAALTTGGGGLTTGFKVFDSLWQNVSTLNTNLSGYGATLLRPRFRLDSVTANPTVFHLAAQVFLRTA